MSFDGGFFFAGFEGSTGWNRHGEWIDQIATTEHDLRVERDYALLRAVGIRAARESLRWPLVDLRGHYDFSSLRPFLHAGREAGITQLFDLFHFGYPADADPFAPGFPARFAEYCHAAARVLARELPGPLAFAAVNEPSYFAWAAGEVGWFAPHQTGRGPELKLQMARAAIMGIDAVRAVCPDAIAVNPDALCRVTTPPDRGDLAADAAAFNEGAVFESWDMLAGRLHPELGGSAAHLGTIGINYYWTNQWDCTRPGIPLAEDDPRRRPVRRLLLDVAARYGAPMLITETSHVGDRRPAWIREIAGEVRAAVDAGAPVGGICLYPILGMPEWHDRRQWTDMGVWDLRRDGDGLLRVPHEPSLQALREVMESADDCRPDAAAPPDVADLAPGDAEPPRAD